MGFVPSIEHKLQTHIRLIERIKSVLPITRTVIEVASFDTQKMRNPEISGVEYQQGELLGYEIREYLLEKFHRKCVYCGKTNTLLEIEHIIP
ncbi:MAG: HNH endonuclease, partial [Candidatus Thermoplasmatota archaeon]|nr:HNH endonuclease [Candidatus Thermoplasmatota archaeon]